MSDSVVAKRISARLRDADGTQDELVAEAVAWINAAMAAAGYEPVDIPEAALEALWAPYEEEERAMSNDVDADHG